MAPTNQPIQLNITIAAHQPPPYGAINGAAAHDELLPPPYCSPGTRATEHSVPLWLADEVLPPAYGAYELRTHRDLESGREIFREVEEAYRRYELRLLFCIFVAAVVFWGIALLSPGWDTGDSSSGWDWV